MTDDRVAQLRANETALAPTVLSLNRIRNETQRRHVLNRSMQEKSGRLYCGEDGDVEIPSLEIYAAR